MLISMPFHAEYPLVVKPERKRPLPPAQKGRAKGKERLNSSIPQRSQPSLERTCNNLINHRPRAQPNCFRCAMQVGGMDSICGLCFRLGRVGGIPLFAVGIGALNGIIPPTVRM